jgi:glycosyltransferase involved in cell wall biosynthesis
VVKLIRKGRIVDGDIIYFEDFWTPGVEGIRYAAELAGIDLKFYTMLHAQSVDKYDFIAKLKYWVRYYEIGQSKFMDGVFVTSEYLMDLCEEAGIENTIFGGLPYNRNFIMNRFPVVTSKQNQVIFCSRFDSEKNVPFFIEVAKKLHSEFKFVMTTSASQIKSNDPYVIDLIINAEKKGYVEVKVGLNKEEYYKELQKSKYQFNSAFQDWLSWTMLEALTYKCIPVYPRYRSFPEYLPSEYLYTPWEVDDAVKVIRNRSRFDNNLDKIVEKFDKSMERYLTAMELI